MSETDYNRGAINSRWPYRLVQSASELCRASQALKDALSHSRRFELLTADTNTQPEAIDEIRRFHREIVSALAALIDLTAHDNPDRAFPDLTHWFEFRCPNAVYGLHTDVVANSSSVSPSA